MEWMPRFLSFFKTKNTQPASLPISIHPPGSLGEFLHLEGVPALRNKSPNQMPALLPAAGLAGPCLSTLVLACTLGSYNLCTLRSLVPLLSSFFPGSYSYVFCVHSDRSSREPAMVYRDIDLSPGACQQSHPWGSQMSSYLPVM